MEAQGRLGMTLYEKIILLSLTGLCSLSLVASNSDTHIATLYERIAQNQRDISDEKERQIRLLNHRIDILQERLKNAGLQAQKTSDKGIQSEPILRPKSGISKHTTVYPQLNIDKKDTRRPLVLSVAQTKKTASCSRSLLYGAALTTAYVGYSAWSWSKGNQFIGQSFMKPFFETITQKLHTGLHHIGTKVAESSFGKTYLPKPEIKVVRFPTLEPTTLGRWLGKLAFTQTEITYRY